MNEFIEENNNNAFTNIIDNSKLMSKVFFWMFVAIGLSGATAFLTSANKELFNVIYGNPIIFFVLLIVEIVLVVILSMKIQKISYFTAAIGLIAYSIINGLTLSFIFLIYELGSISLVFFITAGLFGVMAFLGYNTRIDLSRLGNICLIGLIGVIIASIINLFLKSTILELVTCAIGIIIFIGLIAFDMQKIKNLSQECTEEQVNNLSIICALTVYLDFVNLFLKILRILGKRKR